MRYLAKWRQSTNVDLSWCQVGPERGATYQINKIKQIKNVDFWQCKCIKVKQIESCRSESTLDCRSRPVLCIVQSGLLEPTQF